MQISRRHACTFLGTLLSAPALGALGPLGTRARRGTNSGAQAQGLLGAVRAGDLERVRALVAQDPALARTLDETGRSAFVLASLHGHASIAEVLRGTGLELDIVEAVLAKDWARMESLGKAHPELLSAAHPIGGTPLYAAALVGSQSMWRLRSLGCDPDAAPVGGSGYTPARGALESARATWARIALTDLVSNGADINARQLAGDTVLHAAVARRDETLVCLAIRKGADVDALDERGRSPRALAKQLRWAQGEKLLAGHQSLLRDDRSSRFALDANREAIVMPDLSDVPQGLQSSVTGSSHGNLKGVREHVAADGRLVFSVSTDDELAIEACAHTGAGEIIRFHLDHGAPLSLPTAVSLGDLESVAFWLERSPGLANERGAHDFPVMWYVVAGGGSVEMAELLGHHGVPVDQETMGSTALHDCAPRGQHDFAKWLLEHGADPATVGYRQNSEGRTPLQLAQEAGDAKMVALLRG